MTNNIYTSEHKHLVIKLKQARLTAGLNQKQAAKLLGKTQSHISKLEAGQNRIDIVQLKKIAQIYNQNIAYFIGE